MNGNRDDETPLDQPLLLSALEDLNREEAVDLLEHPIRRRVLHDLDPQEGPIALSDLAERVANPDVRGGAGVAVRSPDGNSTDTTPGERVAIQLHHVHLPKLDDCGLVEYDHRENIVSANRSP